MNKYLLLFYLRQLKQLNSPDRIIEFSCNRHKDKVFLINAQDYATSTFSEIYERVTRVILFLEENGLAKGDVVAFSAFNCFQYYEIRLACHVAGFIFLGLPQSLQPEEVALFLKTTNAKFFFYGSRREKCDELILGLNAMASLKALDLTSDAYAAIFDNIAYYSRPQGTPSQDDIATLNLSSATTAKAPKVVQLSNGNWTESLYNYIANAEISLKKEVIFLSVVPLVTAGSTTVLPTLLAGITNIVVREDIPVHLLAEYIWQYRVNRIYITPSRLLELYEWGLKNDKRFGSLDNIITGTEKFPESRLKEAIHFFGPIISIGYGMVEALPPIAMHSPRDYSKLDSVGKVVKGVEAKINEDGKIAIRSKTVCKGYLNNPQENERCFRDGWVYTNDFGFIDPDRFLYLKGRQEEILVDQPRMIFAKEIEDKVYSLVFVDRCAALSKGGQVAIFVSLRQPIRQEEASGAIRAALGDTGILRHPVSIIIKDALYVSPLGKLDKRRLMQEIV